VVLTTQELAVVMGYADEDKFQPIVKPIMKKVRRGVREEVERLAWVQQSITITPPSKIQIVVNKDIYQLEDEHWN